MGALVQFNASAFAWLESRGSALTLNGAIDNATGTGLALYFCPTEDPHGYTNPAGPPLHPLRVAANRVWRPLRGSL